MPNYHVFVTMCLIDYVLFVWFSAVGIQCADHIFGSQPPVRLC